MKKNNGVEQNSEDNSEKWFIKYSFWIFCVIVLTYVCIYLFILMPRATGFSLFSVENTNSYSSSVLEWFGFNNQNDQTLGFNGLGDALSGFFAPLAFLGLAYAVFIQSRQLSLQRQEMLNNKLVITSELDALKQEEVRRSERENYRLFLENLELLKSNVCGGFLRILFEKPNVGTNYQTLSLLSHDDFKIIKLGNLVSQDYFETIRLILNEALSNLIKYIDRKFYNFKYNASNYDKLIALCYQLDLHMNLISDCNAKLYSNASYGEIADILIKIKTELIKIGAYSENDITHYN